MDFQLDHTYNQLNSISERCVQKTTHCLTELHRYLFSGKREDGGERYDGKEVENENSCGIPAHCASNYTQRYEDQKDIDIVAVQCHFSSLHDLCRNPHELVLTVQSRRMVLVRKELEERRQRALSAIGVTILSSAHQTRGLRRRAVRCVWHIGVCAFTRSLRALQFFAELLR